MPVGDKWDYSLQGLPQSFVTRLDTSAGIPTGNFIIQKTAEKASKDPVHHGDRIVSGTPDAPLIAVQVLYKYSAARETDMEKTRTIFRDGGRVGLPIHLMSGDFIRVVVAMAPVNELEACVLFQCQENNIRAIEDFSSLSS